MAFGTFTLTVQFDPATLAQWQRIESGIARIEAGITQLLTGEKIIMADLTALTSQVAQNTTVEGSAVTLLNGLAAQLKAAGTDPVALAALQQQLNISASALAAAVTANTPAAPAPPAPAPAP